MADERRLLTVRPGRRGLAQSEMVFQHTRNLPDLLERCQLDGRPLLAIGVSSKPRPLADSYMPAFLAGLGTARSLAHLLQVPLHRLTHQHNHMFAGLWSARVLPPEKLLVVHVSGGTTDLLLAERTPSGQYTLLPQGTSIDLHAGQMIDRVGVAMGLAFSAGAALEEIARKSTQPYELPFWTQEGNMSLSGPATKALRAIEKGEDPAAVALGTERVIARALGKTISFVCGKNAVPDVLFVGGVSANEEIRGYLRRVLNDKGIHLITPDPRYSVDGAVGCAFYALLEERGMTCDFW